MLVSVNDRALYTSPVLIMQLYTTASRSEGCLLCCRLAAVLQVGCCAAGWLLCCRLAAVLQVGCCVAGCLLCCRLAAVLQVGWKYSFLCISILFSSSKIAKYTKVFLRTIQNLEQS